jgi:DNA replication protein DnaC
VNAKMTDAAATAAIGVATRELRMPVVRTEAGRLAELAQRSQWSLAYLAEVLASEVDTRAEHRRRRRVAEARLPRIKRLADFDLAAAPSVNPATISTLASGSYLEAGEPVILLGDSGTGKSHLLIGLGHAACEQGRKVRYATAAQLVNELVEAADDRRLSRIVARYGRLDLLCLDEFGYVQLDARGSELLFQILTEREEEASVAMASNLPFSEWARSSPIPDSSPPSSTASPSTHTSSRPEPTATGCAPPRPAPAARPHERHDQARTPGTSRLLESLHEPHRRPNLRWGHNS